MNLETLREEHQDADFKDKKTAYFQKFMLRHLPEAHVYKQYGLLAEEGSAGWRNVAKHQLLSGVMTETLSELLGRSEEETKEITHYSLIHDVDKRRQVESKKNDEIWRDELGKTEKPLVATGSNFEGFPNWGPDEYILRYVDSSVGEETPRNLFGAADTKKPSESIIVPWRERVGGFKTNKTEEGEKGRTLYNGMSTWEKLEEVMTTIETDLFNKVIEKNPDLSEKYKDPSQLTELIEDKIHQKITSAASA